MKNKILLFWLFLIKIDCFIVKKINKWIYFSNDNLNVQKYTQRKINRAEDLWKYIHKTYLMKANFFGCNSQCIKVYKSKLPKYVYTG